MQDNICSPITSLDELYQCIQQPPAWTKAIIKLKNRSDYVIKNTKLDCHVEAFNFFPKHRIRKDLVPKTLICHDMKNGYLEDKYLNGINIGNGYTFYRWSQIDIFVYFSHHLITVPPLSWINVAHKHGVPILGTFITEWDSGKLICDHIFEDVNRLKTVANALIDLCSIFKLDGWLINIENAVANPPNLKLFVQYLTSKLHERRTNSYIIWYDSVTKDGTLKWQNELNENNMCYFDSCDGIFLNYTWKEINLVETVKKAQHRVQDVYVGLDVFGRGCFGGGQFKSYVAAEIVRKLNLSLAIFAQGWTHETLEKSPEENFLKRFRLRDNIWWNSLWPHLYSHPLKYGFETMFQIGVDSETYNLQSQSYQLTNFLSCEKIPEINELDLLKDQCLCLKGDPIYNTNVCTISNQHLLDGEAFVHRLFSTEIFLNGIYVVYCYTKSHKNKKFDIILLTMNKYQHINKIICHSSSSRVGYRTESGNEVTPMIDVARLRRNHTSEDWKLTAFEIEFAEDTMLEIGIVIHGKNALDLCGFGISI